jgi:hypothetical protein
LTASRSIPSRSTSSKYSFNLVWSWPPSVSHDMLKYSFQVYLKVHSISASKWISNHAQSQLPSASLGSLDLSVSKCISKLARSGRNVLLWVHSISRSPCVTPNSLNPCPQVQLWVPSIPVSKCIFKHARSRLPRRLLTSATRWTVIQG